MGETNEPDVFGQDLLSEALGQSGLNLDEYLGIAPGNVLSQAMLDVGNIGPSDSDFLDDLNLSGDFGEDTSYITFSAPNNSAVASNYASVRDNKAQVSGVQQTFLEQPQTLPNLVPQGTIFETPGQLPLTSQTQQFASKLATPLGIQGLQNSTSSPILLNLLNSGNTSSTSIASSVTDTKKELTKK